MAGFSPAAAGGAITRAVLFLIVSLLAGVLVAGLVLPVLGSLGLAAQKSAEGFESLPAELETPPLPERSRILSSDGTQIATFFYENRVSVPLTDVAPVMRQAVVAIEDSRFYEHGGIDLRGTMRAFVNNSSGADVQGGSTLTQQYVKQVLLESAQNIKDKNARIEAQKSATERSYSRKIRELRFAITLEEKYSKDEILGRYLNIAYFGAGAYGVEAAARHYFSIPAKKLTLAQAATLAGIVQQPTAYDPTRNPELSLTRRNIVLTRMQAVGYATPQQVAEAKATKLGLKVRKTTGNGCQTSGVPFFCDFVLKTILNDKAFGAQKDERLRLLLRGGLTIKTTLDLTMQRAAQKAIKNYVNPRDKVASAIASVEPGTGEIKAIAVSRAFGDRKGEIKFNPATDRAFGGSNGFQAGSSFKPFVAAAALEKGIPFGYRIYSPFQKSIGNVQACNGTLTDKWSPRNESMSENGSYTLQTGIAGSINTYFAQLEERTGVCRPASIARELGMTRADGKPLQQLKSFTLGTNEVSPLSMAEAYATFAARGEHCNAIAITSVIDNQRHRLKVPLAGCEQVLDKDIADGMNALLQGVMTAGTGRRAALSRVAAGKTGTTNRRISAWFVGYVPQLATAVWVGNPSPPPGGYPMYNRTIGGRYYASVCGGCLPGPIWRQMMTASLQGIPVKGFVRPPFKILRGDAIRVPSVTGLTVGEAASRLQAAGFSVRVNNRAVWSLGVGKGRVAYTSPGGGSSAYQGQTVTLFISKGPPPIPKPDPAPTTTPPGGGGTPTCKPKNCPPPPGG
ncbi:MAG: penicillin-binding protein [Sporichthyaceae bacterium]